MKGKTAGGLTICEVGRKRKESRMIKVEQKRAILVSAAKKLRKNSWLPEYSEYL